MIDITLQFLTDELNEYLATSQDPASQGDLPFVTGNAARIFDMDANHPEALLSNRGVLSLINVEEDHMLRRQTDFPRKTGDVSQNSPDFLNLYVLFAMNHHSYPNALRSLYGILGFFKEYPLFTPATHPGLNKGVVQISAELMSLTFEQQKEIWSMLGGQYLPSACYKITLVTSQKSTKIPVEQL